MQTLPFITQLGEEMAAQRSYINKSRLLEQHGVSGGDDALSSLTFLSYRSLYSEDFGRLLLFNAIPFQEMEFIKVKVTCRLPIEF